MLRIIRFIIYQRSVRLKTHPGSGNGRSYEHVHGTACQRVRSLGVPLAAPGAQFLIQQTATEVNAVKRKLLHCLGELEG
jgi:hypothetical protein